MQQAQESISATRFNEQPPLPFWDTSTIGFLGFLKSGSSKQVVSNWLDEVGTSTIRMLDHKISQLKEIYEFTNEPEIVRYLEDYDFLVDFLFKSFPQIENYFGANPHVALEVVHDPEIVGEPDLVAYIHTMLSPEEAVDKLSLLEREWFLDQIDTTKGKLYFNIEFT